PGEAHAIQRCSLDMWNAEQKSVLQTVSGRRGQRFGRTVIKSAQTCSVCRREGRRLALAQCDNRRFHWFTITCVRNNGKRFAVNTSGVKARDVALTATFGLAGAAFARQSRDLVGRCVR
ncbi:MAG: hypothetical protein AAFU79_37275, partial [Myxococcota bacterium]